MTTTTGPLSVEQRHWLGVLHAGPGALIGGLSAAELHGLSGWERQAITVLVDDQLSFDRVPGYRFVRCRRDLIALRSAKVLPVARIEPAILLFAAYWPQRRTAHGAIAAVVQQRLTTPDRLREDLAGLRPIRGAAELRSLLDDLDGGAESIAEIDVVRACRHAGLVLPDRQRRRRDREGRNRWVDCEWDLIDGRTLALEVDGGLHLEIRNYSADMRRQRRITTRDGTVVRCSAEEIRYEPAEVMVDLLALGVRRVA